MTQVLIFDVRGPQYRALLERRFPTVGFHIGHHVEDADNVIADINVIVGLGHHIPAALIAKAKSLKWVQALTTGRLVAVRGCSGPRRCTVHITAHNGRTVLSRLAGD